MPEAGSPHSTGGVAATTKSEAEQILIEAIKAANNDGTIAVLQQTMAGFCIRTGLEPLKASGYKLLPVLMCQFGADAAFRAAKAASIFASKKLKQVVISRHTVGFALTDDLVLGKRLEKVVMDITKLIPNPTAEVQSLLPTVTWPEPAVSGSSSADFLSPFSNDSTSQFPEAQPATDQQLDPVISMLDLLPSEVTTSIKQQLGLGACARAYYSISRRPSATSLTDVIADLGRPVRLRFNCSITADSQAREQELPITMDLNQALCNLNVLRLSEGSVAPRDIFQDSSRMGVSQTLHRISALKNRYGDVCGLTYRVGRHIPGVADCISDIVAKVASCSGRQQSSGSLLLIGPPGVGKTTLLRDVTRQLADAFHKLVMVVDPSEEIAGGGNLPHPCIGSARRMLGTVRQSKYELLEEAVANHGPEVIVVDEIGNAKEVAAIKDIASRGVTMVATVHGTSLQHLLENPVLSPLVGGKQRMVIGDFAAAQMQNGRKTRSERLEMPTFSTVIEIQDQHTWLVHGDVAASVDSILAGSAPATDCRQNI